MQKTMNSAFLVCVITTTSIVTVLLIRTIYVGYINSNQQQYMINIHTYITTFYLYSITSISLVIPMCFQETP